jgi:DNA adenine methylase
MSKTDSYGNPLDLKSNKPNSPFRYAGGKFYARKIILSQLKQSQSYCEPFAGGASIYFAQKEQMNFNWLNDFDEELVNTYLIIRDNLKNLAKHLDGIEASKELHYFYKNEYKPRNDVERAFRWYYLNRTSYSGIMKKENCYWGYGEKYSMQPKNWVPHLRTVSERLQNVKITNIDFEEVIDSVQNGTMLFIDPPYFNADQKKFYTCNFELDDHIRLMKCLKRNSTRIDFLLTYDNSKEIRDLYDWCPNVNEQSWNYTISRTDDQKNKKKLEDGHKSQRKKGKEIFLKNY